MNKERFNVEEHTTLDGRVLDVFPISHRYIHELEQQCKKQKEVINKVNNYIKKHSFFVIDTWYNKKIGYPKDTFSTQEILDILKEVSE